MGRGEVTGKAQRDKSTLDRAVARSLFVSRKEVRVITDEFVAELRKLLAETGDVTIKGLGRFRVERVEPKPGNTRELVTGSFKKGERRGTRTVEVSRYSRVHFSQSGILKEMLNKEPEMEKYAVDESVNQESLEKQAAKGCPQCGSDLTKHGSVLLCPVHGSSPFEVPQQGGNNGSKENSNT